MNIFRLIAKTNPFLLFKGLVSSPKKKQEVDLITLGAIHIGFHYKVLKVRKKKGKILLGFCPTIECPRGYEELWYSIKGIPEKLQKRGIVIKIEDYKNEEVICSKVA